MIFKEKYFSSISKKQCIETGMVVALIVVCVGLYTQKQIFQFLTIVILVINILVPSFFYPLAVIWFGISKLLGSITLKFLLGIVFYLVVTPFGLVQRFFRRDRLHIREFKKNSLSVFIVRNHIYESIDLKDMF
jgi:ABC-type nitrate/sulfonate/bicarbonate transport system permease component